MWELLSKWNFRVSVHYFSDITWLLHNEIITTQRTYHVTGPTNAYSDLILTVMLQEIDGFSSIAW